MRTFLCVMTHQRRLGAVLLLAGYDTGVAECAPMLSKRLGFTEADTITLSNRNHYLFFQCTTFAGDLGVAVTVKCGCLVGTHQQVINALQERLQHAKDLKERLSKAIHAIVNGGVAQGCCALLSSALAS